MIAKPSIASPSPPPWLALLNDIGKLVALSLKAGFLFLLAVTPASGIAQYEAWRHRLLLSGLRIGLRIALVVSLLSLGWELYLTGFILDWRGFLSVMAAIGLYFCLVLQHSRWGRANPKLLFLGAYWLVTLLPGLKHLSQGDISPCFTPWTGVFVLAAALMPAYWSLHLTAQLGVLLFYLGSWILLSAFPPDGLSPSSFNQTLYLFWVCFICCLAIALYEQFRLREMGPSLRVRRSRLQGATSSHLSPRPTRRPRRTLAGVFHRSQRILRYFTAYLETYLVRIELVEVAERSTSLGRVAEEVMTRLQSQTEHEIRFINTISQQFPRVNVDASQLRYILEHLITGALESRPSSHELTLSAGMMPPLAGETSPTSAGKAFCLLETWETKATIASPEEPRVEDNLTLELGRQLVEAQDGDFQISDTWDGLLIQFTLPLTSTSRNPVNLAPVREA